MIHEVWGTAGTAGDYGWEYGTAIVSLGVEDGTSVLQGLDDFESGTIGTAYEFNGGTWYSRIWLNEGNSSKFRQTIADNGAGTRLILDIEQTNIDPFKNTIFWVTESGSTIGTLGSHTEYRSGAYADFIANTVSWDGTDFHGSMELQPVAGTGTTAVFSTDGSFTTPLGSMIIPTFSMDGGGISEIIFPHYIPPDKTIFDFYGSYNNGTNIGSIALGTFVTKIGKVREQLYSPRVSRGWSSRSTVELNDTGWWTGTLAKDMANPEFYDGTWFIRQQWNGTWHTLLTGYISPDAINYDYGLSQIKFTVKSILEKQAKKTLLPHTIEWLGTIHNMECHGTKGRILIHRDIGLERGTMYVNEHIWSGSGTDNDTTRIKHFWDNHTEPWSGTWGIGVGGSYYTKSVYFENECEWMEEGGSLWISRSGIYPGRGTLTFWNLLGISSYLSGAEYNWQRMLDYDDVGIRYYGGEKAIDCLTDRMRAKGISYSVNGEGYGKEYIMKPENVNAGTVNFNEITGDKWSFDYTQPVNACTVKYNYDNASGKNLSEITKTGDNYYGGDDISVECGWLSATDFMPRARAQRTIWCEGMPRMKLSVNLPGETWGTYTPGYAVVLENAPAIISEQEINDAYPLHPYSNWTIAARNYDYLTDLIEYELIHQKTTGLFRLDISHADGTDACW